VLWIRDSEHPRPATSPVPASFPVAPTSRSAAQSPAKQKTPVPPAIPVGESIDVCGIGKLTADTEDLEGIQSRLDSSIETARRQWLASMLHSGDLRAHATGLLYESRMSGEWFRNGPSEETAGPLVQLAQSAQDPAVYAMAVYACKPPGGAPSHAGSCERISVNDWAAMDADNAAPWLVLANEARIAKDTAAENAAFAMAAKASRIDNYAWSLFANVEPTLPSTATPLDLYMLSTGFIGFESALPYPSASQHCSAASVSDAAIRSQCGAVAELMVSKGTTMIDIGIGTAIGARVGWPAERVAALKERANAFRDLMLMRQNPFKPRDQWSCEAINKANAHIRDWTRFGEIGAVELELERSGKTITELAHEYKEFEESASAVK
jgi:hypothetical protein